MSPTNLGQLPSQQPAPTGLVQRKQGVAEAVITWNNTVPAQGLQDGGGGLMAIYTPTITRECWWLIHAETMWLQVEAYWIAFEWGVDLNTTDLNNFIRAKTQRNQHSALGWQGSAVDMAYRLAAGASYSCVMVWLYSGGWNQQYHVHPRFHYIEGELIGEGAL